MAEKFNIDLKDYQYNLPSDRIAKHGTSQRQNSKLLVYDHGNIVDKHFYDILSVIPEGSTLFFNDTKVIQARIKMARKTGAIIEVFLLTPEQPTEMATSLASTKGCSWICMIGNARKWKDEEVLETRVTINGIEVPVYAKLKDRDQKLVEFSWANQNLSFGEILDELGRTPLPPYLNRPDGPEDKARYQTVYSKVEGAVAAPTAGLHFTEDILEALEGHGIQKQFLTLHVSAGTFQPISVSKVDEHPMHNERIFVSKQNIEALLNSNFIIPVGTTSMRTLESLYWYGVKLLADPKAEFHIEKLFPYQQTQNIPLKDSLNAVLTYMNDQKIESINGDTEIFIFPGYTFKVCNALVTNFHQPGSTLVLLIAALVGDDWRKIYQHALENNYRFLSYGDSSLLIP